MWAERKALPYLFNQSYDFWRINTFNSVISCQNVKECYFLTLSKLRLKYPDFYPAHYATF